MINELLFMNGYAVYLVTKMQFVKEQNKFVAKFGSLTTEQANSAKSQRINKEILADATNN